MHDYSDELAFALGVAADAGTILLDHYERLERIDAKGEGDVVTEADHLSEGCILEAIRARFPADAILAEESGEHPAGDATPTSGVGRVWIVDPLDGTVNYANGIPVFSVSIALAVDGVATVGVVLDPIRREVYAATVGGPATLDGRVVTTSRKESVSDLVIAMVDDSGRPPSLGRAHGRVLRARSLGSAALELAYVANGRFDAFIQRGGLSTWDIAAAGLIAERGGAIVTSAEGTPWLGLTRSPGAASIVAAPAAHHAAFLEISKRRRRRAPRRTPDA